MVEVTRLCAGKLLLRYKVPTDRPSHSLTSVNPNDSYKRRAAVSLLNVQRCTAEKPALSQKRIASVSSFSPPRVPAAIVENKNSEDALHPGLNPHHLSPLTPLSCRSSPPARSVCMAYPGGH